MARLFLPTLSPRLRACSQALPERYERLIDVACDHALLSAYELAAGHCHSVIATDVGEIPLKRGQANLERYCRGSDYRCILSDGLDFLKAGTAELRDGDAILMTGLGGLQIHDILLRALPDFINYFEKRRVTRFGESKSVQEEPEQQIHFVLQAQKSVSVLRFFLKASGFTNIRESIVRSDSEGRERFYTLLCATLEPASAAVLASYYREYMGLVQSFMGEKQALADAPGLTGPGLAAVYLCPEFESFLRCKHRQCSMNLAELALGYGLSEQIQGSEGSSDVLRYSEREFQRLLRLIRYRAYVPAVGDIAEILPDFIDSLQGWEQGPLVEKWIRILNGELGG